MAKRHTILVVDDEADVVKSVQDLLRLDYRVLGATSAQQGQELLQQHEVHAIMTDQRMPDMTGVEFLHRCRGENPDAVRLLFTGYADIRAVIDAINQGNVYRYIAKPWDPDELQTIIREACERYDLAVERKHMLIELKKKNEELDQANKELREANELKSAFIRVASHELRTPLTILNGLTKMALLREDFNPPQQELLRRIDNASQRMARLVNEIIAMLSAGRFDHVLDCKDSDPAVNLREAADDVRPFIELRKQQLSLDVPQSLGTMSLDAMKIRACLNQLLLNAIKFTPDEGRIVLMGSRETDGALIVRVQDSGGGIDPQNLPRMFQPFFTGYDVSRHSSGEYEFGKQGLGLGLSLVKAFTEMQGGKVSVQSEVGKGSTFTMTLPVCSVT
jgi:signal transduction histidine kinase